MNEIKKPWWIRPVALALYILAGLGSCTLVVLVIIAAVKVVSAI